jgi:hypothetical protein
VHENVRVYDDRFCYRRTTVSSRDRAPAAPASVPFGDRAVHRAPGVSGGESSPHSSLERPSTQFSIVVGALAEAEDRLTVLPRTAEVRALRKRFLELQRVSVDALAKSPTLSETDCTKLVADVIALATEVLLAGRKLDEEK